VGVGTAAVNKESGEYCAAGGFLTLPRQCKFAKTLIHFSGLSSLLAFAGIPETGSSAVP